MSRMWDMLPLAQSVEAKVTIECFLLICSFILGRKLVGLGSHPHWKICRDTHCVEGVISTA